MANFNPEEDTHDYKQIAYSLKHDLEMQKWHQADNDLSFLKEIKENLELGETDVTRIEFAMQMINDWIDELQEIVNK